jgi:oligopeptide/dipeptide ABC transporter ATP-binding protein
MQDRGINLLIDLQKEFEHSYIIIAHDLAVVEHICDQVAVMYLGKIVEYGTYREVYRNPKHPYTQALLSAIPVPDPEAAKQRIILTGDVPSPIRPPPGCHFHPRCSFRMDICDKQKPQLKDVGSGHAVSCFLY